MIWILGGLFITAGIFHFISPGIFKSIVPNYFPKAWHLPLVYGSGVAEILGGVGLLVPSFQSLSAWGLILLMVAVFPANVYMAYHPKFERIPRWIRWARLPLQIPLIYWIFQYTY